MKTGLKFKDQYHLKNFNGLLNQAVLLQQKEYNIGGFKIQSDDHEDAFITPENERYFAGGVRVRSIKVDVFLLQRFKKR